MKKALIVSEIVKKIRGKEVLKSVTFEVEKGQLLVLLGPPGSGKTTLLKIIAGLEKQDSGSIYINGEKVDDKPPYERKVSMVFETLALYSNMTVYENIASPMIAEKKPREIIDKKVKEIASILRIEHLLNRRADKLSGGERQRVAIARALAKEAEIYLLDEPFSNLDAKIRYALRTEFKKLKTMLGKTLVLATSDPLDALALGDIVVFIEKGVIIQKTPPVELYYKPIRLDISRYITGRILNEVVLKKKTEAGKTIITSELDVVISESVLRDLQDIPVENIILTSHPDNTMIEKSIENCDGLKIRGRFLGYEYRGSEFLVFAEYKNHLFKALKYEKPLEDFNEPVDVCIKREGLNFYDHETGSLVR